MKKIHLLILFAVCAGFFVFQSCDNSKTYAEMEEEERDAINRFKNELTDSIGATFISEDQFLAQDSTTGANEFVLFDETGVYMNIVTRGDGEVLGEGTHNILTRFVEIALSNNDQVGCSVGDTLEILSPNKKIFNKKIKVEKIISSEGGETVDSAKKVQEKVVINCPYLLKKGDILRR